MAGTAPLFRVTLMVTNTLPIDFDTTRTREQHVTDHEALHGVYNQQRWLMPGDDLQAHLNAGGLIVLAPGAYSADTLTISKPTKLVGLPGAVLTCNGMICQPSSGLYLDLILQGLTILNAGAGTIGLSLKNCNARLEDVTIKGFNAEGLHIEAGISSLFSRVVVSQNPIGLHTIGATSTSLAFQTCTFDQATTAAVIVEAGINSLSFTDWCVFQSSKRGLILNAANVISLINPYFENIERDLITVGDVAEVQSFVLDNPIAVSGASNDDTTDMFVFDKVNMLTWLGGGDCRIPKASWIKGSANTLAMVLTEPRHLGLPKALDATSKAVIFQRNGRFALDSFQIGNRWNLTSTYFLQVDDLVLGAGNLIAFYSNLAGAGRIGAQNVTGVLTGGIEFDNGGLILRSPNGTPYHLVVNDTGILSAEAL